MHVFRLYIAVSDARTWIRRHQSPPSLPLTRLRRPQALPFHVWASQSGTTAGQGTQAWRRAFWWGIVHHRAARRGGENNEWLSRGGTTDTSVVDIHYRTIFSRFDDETLLRHITRVSALESDKLRDTFREKNRYNPARPFLETKMNQTPTLSRRTALGVFLATAAAAEPLLAIAQTNVVRIITPNSSGSGVDTITRTAAPAMGRALGTSVVVENLPGAGGVVGLQTLARATPDGNTLSVVSSNVVVLPSLMKSLPFSIPGDFTPIALVCVAPLVLVANPNKVPAANAREFFALLKSKPDEFTYASSGNGTVPHLAVEMVMDAAGTKARHIPYKGLGQATTDLIGGQIDFMCAALVAVQPHIASGALRPIGLLSAQRAPAAPNLPTLHEQGLNNFNEEAWIAVIGPKGMSSAAVTRAHDAVQSAFKDPAVMETMSKQGNIVKVSSPVEATAAFRRDLQKYAALVKKIGLEPQ